jgi:predicted phosphodiesterase
MKILVTADLHFEVPRSRAPAEELAERACEEGGEALVLVGDTAGARLPALADALDRFARFGGRRFIVPGNHCLWCAGEEDSMRRYLDILPNLAAGHGFAMLDAQPAMLGGVALVGSVGWYDYSFADKSLGIPEEFYRAKVAPGAAAQLGGFEDMLDRHRGQLGERALAIRSRWMDGRYVRLPMGDEEFCRFLAERLATQLEEVSRQAERVVVFMHHLPFAELLPEGRADPVAFASAYLGSPLFGEVLLAFPKVTDVYCGHSHWHGTCRIGHINVVNVGSTYSRKRLEILEV